MYERDFIQELSDELGEDPDTIKKALWLQEHIRKEGIEETRFMRRSATKMRSESRSVTKKKITTELKKRFE
jgi:hypothetical protein